MATTAIPKPPRAGTDERSRSSRAEDELRAFQERATDILSRLDVEETLLAILNSAVKLIDADIAGVLLADGDGVRMRACTGHRTVATQRLYVGRGQGVAGRVFQTGEPFMVDDYETDTVISRHFVEIARQEGKRSALGAPMFSRGETIGTLMLWRRRPSVFSEEDSRVLASLANLAAIAIVNAELYETERAAVSRLEEVNRQLEQRNDLLRRSSELHDELTRMVLGGSGLVELVGMVARQTGGSAALLDPQLTALAVSDGAAGLVKRGQDYLSTSTVSPMTGTATLAPAGGHPQWLLVTPVVAGGELLAVLCLELAEGPRGLEPTMIEQAAIVCALHLTREQAVWEAQTRLHADLLWDLFDGNVRDETEIAIRARVLGRVLPPQLRVALIEVSDEASRSSEPQGDAATIDRRRWLIARAAERAARDAGCGSALAAWRGSTVGLIFAADDAAPSARRVGESVLRLYARAHPELRVAIGVSGAALLSSSLRGAHDQARRALAAGAMVETAERVTVFDDLGVLQFLLAPGGPGDLKGFARNVLGPILDHAGGGPLDLLATLDAFLANDCSLKRTAETLYVHAKTVRYRLDRAQELAGIDLARQQDRFNVQLALSIVSALSLANDQTPALTDS
jgi:sugar diacid utilization regulator/putative methionine-R-sulfoxide reductase with GAF domain